MSTLDNLIDQALDVKGSLDQTDDLVLSEEPLELGARIAGQSGASASVSAPVSDIQTVTGLTGMTASSAGRFLTLEGTGGNDGTFLITAYNSATSVDILNPLGASEGPIDWQERESYNLETDLNYARTDRSAIKGVDYFDPIPTYFRCTDQATPIPANLSNIAGKTTDAKSFVLTRKYEDAEVSDGYLFITLTDVGNLKHSDNVDVTGVPINDGYDAGNDESTYVELIADGYQQGLLVLSGPNAGNRIFGRTRAGTSTSPDEVEVEFRSVGIDEPLSSSVSYTWEAGQPTSLDVYYPYRDCLDNMDENAFRTTLVNGLIADAGLQGDINNILQVIGVVSDDTDLGPYLTNTGAYYPFYNLPDATPSVVEALNTLNEQIGDRDYTGSILTDGYTITQSLQQLADAISSSTAVTRVIERLSSSISAGTEHTLPGGLSYTLDGTNNGSGMWLFWRKQLQDPGTIAAGDDYEETSTTSFTPYKTIVNKDHINYFIAS